MHHIEMKWILFFSPFFLLFESKVQGEYSRFERFKLKFSCEIRSSRFPPYSGVDSFKLVRSSNSLIWMLFILDLNCFERKICFNFSRIVLDEKPVEWNSFHLNARFIIGSTNLKQPLVILSGPQHTQKANE